MSGHTPLPWLWDEMPKHGPARVTYQTDMGALIGADGSRVCWFGDCETYYPTEGEPPSEHDLAFIVRACNSHYELLEALDQLERVVRVAVPERMRPDTSGVRDLIAKVRGETTQETSNGQG